MSVRALAAILRTQVAQVEQQRAALLAVMQKWAGARDALHAATREAEAQEAVRSVLALSEGIAALERAVAHLGAVPEHVAAYGPALGVDLGRGAGDQGRQPQPRGTGAGTRDNAVWIQDAGASLPDRPGDVGPTHGRVFGAAGDEWTDPRFTHPSGYLRSGAVPDAREGLRPDWFPRAQVIREHVESHAAALLRRPGSPAEAVLVINKPTCRSRRRYVGCDQVLPGMLPVGKRLVVFVADGQETRLEAVYTGTGEGIVS